MRDRIVFYLNGQKREVGSEKAGMMLADYLRQEEALTGTKIVCAEGDCGACTVLRQFARPKASKSSDYQSINSCVTTVAQMDGSSLITVDALREAPCSTPEDQAPEDRSGFSPVQKAMLKHHGSQCGFCTPGIVMALTGLVEKRLACSGSGEKIGVQEAKNALTGNLCRCTGYQPILDAAISIDLAECTSIVERFFTKDQKKDLKKALSRGVVIRGEGFSFYAPRTLREAAQYLKKNPEARIIAGGTDLGVVHNKRKIRLTQLLSLHLIPQLYSIKKSGTGTKRRITVGARVTLSELREFGRELLPELARFLDIFASPQIKNTATLVGNVCNASPIADTPPFLLVAGATLTLVGSKGKRKVPIEKFYNAYRQTELRAGEFVSEISFEIPEKTESVSLYKVSQRKDLDISTVNAAFRMKWDSKRRRISSIRMALGGVAAVPQRLWETEKTLQGSDLSSESFTQAAATLHSEMNPISDLRGTSAFRRVLVENLLRRFFDEQKAHQEVSN